MYICASDFNVSNNGVPIDVLNIDHVATQGDGSILLNITLLEDGKIKQRLCSSDELCFTRKAGAK